MRIVVADCGSGNVRSVMRMCHKAGADVIKSDNHTELIDADGIIVPGVGDFASVADALRLHGIDKVISERIAHNKPILGICVGLQVMFESSAERHTDTAGLALFTGRVERLQAPIVPHMGWSQVQGDPNSRLLDGLENEYFYFAHSYAVPLHSDSTCATETQQDATSSLSARPVESIEPRYKAHHEDTQLSISSSIYGQPFVAAIEYGCVSATQFHPEKSGSSGERLIRNWLESVKESA